MRPLFIIAIPVAVLALAGCGREHVEANAFSWSGTVPAGGWLRLRNLQGRITVDSSTAPQVQVTASMRWRGSRGDVRFAQRTEGNDVVICTMYGEGGVCDSSAYTTSQRNGRQHGHFLISGGHSSVSYVVRVPPGVKVDVSTVQGSVLVSGTTAAVTARTIDGSVGVATGSGPLDISSVNGSVKASVNAATNPDQIKLETVNGSVKAELPAALQGAFSLETVNGSVRSDFPLPVNAAEKHHLTGTIGTGGGTVKLNTVNGSVTLTKRG